MQCKRHIRPSRKIIYCFDLDKTLCTHAKDYMKAKPKRERIAIVNDLYDNGCTIIINTARGTVSGLKWFKKTSAQLKKWGLKYHQLIVGVKPHYDFWVDDKAINSEEFFLCE